MKKKIKDNSGFTLAELLIVVAIIAVLVAIAVPLFNAQLEKARAATDAANIRSAYAELSAAYLSTSKSNFISTRTVSMEHTKASTQVKLPKGLSGDVSGTTKGSSVTLTVSKDGKITIGSGSGGGGGNTSSSP